MSSPHIAFASSATPISAAAVGPLPQTTSALRSVPESASQPRAFHYAFSPAPSRPGTTDTRPSSALRKLSPSPLPSTSTSPSPSPTPAFLPRTSSLLPTARVPVKLSSPVTSTFAFPPNAFDAGPKPVSVSAAARPAVDPLVTLSPPEEPASPPPASPVRHRPLHGPSRSSSSARAAPDSVRGGLHRWSTSTGSSSRASNADGRPLVHRHQRSASFSRRLSVDSAASSLHRDPAAAAAAAAAPTTTTRSAAPTTAPPPPPSSSDSPVQQHTPRKLQKNRPSITAHTGSPHRASPRALVDRELPPVPSTPFESLPPIVALPSLEQELQNGSASLLGRTTTPPPRRARPHVRHPSSEDNIRSFYFGNAPPPAAAPVTERPASALATSPPQTHKQPPAAATMPATGEPQTSRPPSRGYSRSRAENTKGSTDSTKSRGSRPPSQKAMLSRALQKAHTAVQLDNAGNFEGAREAYTEACELLQQVLYKTPGQEDKQKLEAIRETYTARIDELDQLQLVSAPAQDNRPLPQRPQNRAAERRANADAYADDDAHVGSDLDDADAEEEAIIETVTVTRIYNDHVAPEATQPRSIPSYSVPLAAPSSSSPRLMQSAFSSAANNSSPRHGPSLLNDQYTLQSSFSRSPRSEFAPPNRAPAWAAAASANTLQPPATINPYMPPPLSPRRIAPPPRPFEDAPTYGVSAAQAGRNAPTGHNGLNILNNGNGVPGHTRTASHESVSWLDPINESGSSAPSSVHSRSSSLKVRRKHIRAASGATEAEFDAALDDAIEAAYDDGYEPMPPTAGTTARPSNFGKYRDDDDDPISSSMRRVELAKERVRETEREAKAFERQFRLREQLRQQQQLEEDQEEQEQQQQQQQQQRSPPARGLAHRDLTTNFLSTGDDSEDEERLLEEMTTAIEDFALGTTGPKSKGPPPLPMQKPPLPREPDSSEGSLRAWHRPTTPNAAIAAAAAAAGASTPGSSFDHNLTSPPTLAKGPTYVMPPPPTQALPQLPPQPHRLPAGSQSPARAGSAMSVRSRRLSGQAMKQLKIETTKLGPPPTFNRPAPATAGGAYGNASGSLPASAAGPQQPRTAGGFMAQQRQALSAGSRPGSSAGLRPGSSAGPRPGSSAGPRPGSSAAAGSSSLPFSMRQGTNASMGSVFGASPTAEHMPPPNFPPPTPPIPQGGSFGENDSTVGRSGSPSTSRPGLRKNFSSSSLRSMRSRNMSVTNLDGTSDMSPGTPLSNHFVPSSRLPEVPSLPATAAAATATATATALKDRANGAGGGVGSLRLLENDFHSPTTPGSPNALAADAPVPLEPCPTDMLLRPFWLMRCLYQTLAHPRGGYLSNKLFVPTDVWKVKGVKLKNVDEKVANCELLTEALQSLSRVVEEYDADVVLKEMEALESVLEQVQAVLARKLGSEVGVQSTHALFKDASPLAHDDAAAAGAAAASTTSGGGATSTHSSGGGGAVPRTGSVSNNARSFSWRRLRPKNSSAGLNSGLAAGGSGSSGGSGRKDGAADGGGGGGGGGGAGGSSGALGGGTLASLPMTPHPTSRPAKRDVAAVKFSGPNAAYMRALARLFDAAQLIDQVARQVEDPGLRHADQTQVGLELSTRHAAEFFAFYICRFVLSDVSLLLEKFIKRGSEWVMV